MPSWSTLTNSSKINNTTNAESTLHLIEVAGRHKDDQRIHRIEPSSNRVQRISKQDPQCLKENAYPKDYPVDILTAINIKLYQNRPQNHNQNNHHQVVKSPKIHHELYYWNIIVLAQLIANSEVAELISTMTII